MKILAIVAGVVLLIVGEVAFALVAILALPGSSMDADTRLGAAILLVVALSAAVGGDVLLVVGLQQLVTVDPKGGLADLTQIDQPNPTAPYGHDGGPKVHAVGAGADRTPTTVEAPAIVYLLLHCWGSSADAAAATLLDLAARGHLELVFEPTGRLVGRVPNIGRQKPPAPFEEMLLRQVMGRLAGGSAPAQALLPYPRDQDAGAWYATFYAKVIDEARRMGLVRGHFPLGRRVGRRLTSAGRAAAARWVVARSRGPLAAARWRPQAGAALSDRSLAWAVALGVATDLRRAVTPPAGPVWSPAGGRWRLVRIPWWPRGRAPRWARAHPERVSGSSTLTGLVIRRSMIDMSTEYGSSALYNVVVDDGAIARAWWLPPGDYAKFATGDTVRVTFDHRGRLVEMVRWPEGAAEAGGSSYLPTTSGGEGVSEDSAALVARHGWRASWPALTIAGLLAVAIALSLVAVTMSPQDPAAFGVVLLVSIFVVWLLLLEGLFLVLGGVFLGLLFVLAARRAIALSIDARGITLGALPLRRWVLLGRQRRDVRAAGSDRFIPWPEVATVHLPDTSRAWSGFWGAALGVLNPSSMTTGLAAPWGLSVEVRRRDGTSARRAMRGVRYDAFGFAEAVRRYAPEVLVTVERQINTG